MSEPRLRDVVAAFDELYPPALAESWDTVGLTVGDPGAVVRRVLFAVDPVAAVVEEAVELGADLLVTHHPLLLRGVHAVAETSAKGRAVARLVRAGIGLFTAHTNADIARPGVSDALADALGVVDLEPLDLVPGDSLDKLVVYVPEVDAERLLDALAAAGAGAVGAYTRCAFTSVGTGTFTPGPGAHPTIGRRGQRETVREARLEMVLARPLRAQVVCALLAAHPYEQPAYDVVETGSPAGPARSCLGLGRVGRLPEPEPLRAFLDRAARALPATAGGLRATGDPDRAVHRVAVCGGAGDGLLSTARRSGVDAYLTADLRHHPASEADEEGGPVLVDAAHWATEWPWLARAAAALQATLATVAVEVSTRVTDPWTLQR